MLHLPLLGAIFDVDGTLVKTDKLQYSFHRYIALHPKFGAMESFPRRSKAWHKEYNEAYKKGSLAGLYGRYGKITPENFHDMYSAIEEEYFVFIRQFKGSTIVDVRDGSTHDTVPDAIRTIWERGSLTEHKDIRLRLAINTTKEKRNVQPLLERQGIWQYFDTSVTLDDVIRDAANGEAKRHGWENLPYDAKELRKYIPKDVLKSREKPNADSTKLTVERMGLPMESVIVFEDTEPGVLAAKKVPLPFGKYQDMYVVGVMWGDEKNPDVLKKAGADEIIYKPSQMVEIIEKFGGFS